ncbi:MAG: hypothetical protein IRY99_22410, partial [Isosphaeraceae bacterium]|nr:hypothetical protein [Isosphaeraceae bacterium]
RLVWLTVGLAPVVLIVMIAVYWVLDHVPQRNLWQTGLGLLIALEIAYGVVVAATLVLTPALGLALFRGRRRKRGSPRVARGLLLCVSLLFGLALAEAIAALWQARTHRATVLPVGGLDRAEQARPSRRYPDPSEEIQLPEEFPDPPDDEEVDLVVLGESSAEGVPYNAWLSIGAIVAWQLEEAIPGRRVHLKVLASSGETLERQQRKLAELDRRPDALIIYCGHNEFSSRFPWSRDWAYYLDEQVPSAWDRFVERVERTSPLCRLIREQADKCRIAIPPPPQGHRALVDIPVYTPSEYAALLADFQRRLETIVAYAERIGALPILILPPANDSGFEPNRSFLPARTPRAERAAFARDFQAARRLEATDPARAIAQYRALLARQPGFAETHYRLARLLERQGAWEEVYRHDLAARDLDGLPMRCPTPFQEAYRAVASRHDSIFIDGQAYFHAIGRHGLLDDHLFHDGIHPSLRGQIALAQAVLRALWARRAFGWPSGSPAPTLDPARLAARFGLGPEQWRAVCLWGIMFYDLTAPVHYDPSARRAKQAAFASAARRIAAGQAPEAVGLPNIGLPAAVPY